jgi:hypothetical protein
VFSKSSRYFPLPDLIWRGPDGREVTYRSRRLIPRGGARLEKLTVVGQSERLDIVAGRTLGRPEAFWKLCDANGALDPFELAPLEPEGARPLEERGSHSPERRVLRVPEI